MNDLYTYTVPIFTKMLGGLDNVLTKAEAYANAEGLDSEVLFDAKLAPDMYPFIRQVQIACDNAKGCTARLGGVEVPKYEDNERTFSDLHARVAKTLEFIKSVPESAFKDAATREVTLPYFPGKYFTGFDYAREYALPNFFFHTTIAYGILRSKGVPLGKPDYMNGLSLKNIG